MVLYIIVGLVLIGLYAWYASIVRRRNRVGEALAGIDAQLNQRHDLVPQANTENRLAAVDQFPDRGNRIVTRLRITRAVG